MANECILVSLSITGVINNNEIQQENKSTNKEQHQMQKKKIVCSKNHVEKNPESTDFVVTEQITFWLKKSPPTIEN